MWTTVEKLKDPFNDAVNYRAREQKEFFNKLFLKTEELNNILKPTVYYLMGEKGTGKTAYATYMENNGTNENHCKLVTMTETQYKRFIQMKEQGQLSYSDYSSIWRSTLLFIVSQMIIEKHNSFIENFANRFTGKFKKVEEAVNKWNKHALNPEVESALEALFSETLTANIGKKEVATIGGEQKQQNIHRNTIIKHNLLETETVLKEALQSLKLKKSCTIFIDGIDFRPEQISYLEYLNCIKGLGEATWQLNTEFFNTIRDSKGRIKIVLLLRPDVFHNLNLYNSNSRIQDNTVFLNWSTTEAEYESSHLYEACGKYLSSQQAGKTKPHEAWANYFSDDRTTGDSFKKLLRNSFQKPRDILTYIKYLKSLHIKKRIGDHQKFDIALLNNPNFTRDVADYLLGEVRNYSAFYMTPTDFSAYLKFFQYLNGNSKISIEEFNVAHKKFAAWANGENIKAKEYMRDPEALPQFFYDVNIIGYKEASTNDSENFFHWSYKERSLNNIAPKVKNAAELMINQGICKALDIGKTMATKNNTNEQKPIERKKPTYRQREYRNRHRR